MVPVFTQQTPEALASVASDSVALYLSAPMVQGPTATGGNVYIETFDNDQTDDARRYCPSTSDVYTAIEQSTPVDATADVAACGVYNPYFHPWGGASTTSSLPTYNLTENDTMTSYGQVHGDQTFTLTLRHPSRYVGFWWTSGGAGNEVRFFDQNNVQIASFETNEIFTTLESAEVYSIDSMTRYYKSYFQGHPAGHSSVTPAENTSTKPTHVTQTGNWDQSGLFAYLNLYVGGSVSVAKIQFIGGGTGFEFDNLTISENSQNPANSMVKISEKRSDAPLVIPPRPRPPFTNPEPVTPPTETTVDPCVRAETEPVTKRSRSFAGFAISSAVLTPAMKRQIRNWLNKHPEEVCVSIAGFTMGPRVLATDPKLAKDRARAVRAYIKKLRPDASFTPITSRTQKRIGDEVRRAKVTLRY
jgi:hypothetical protein